MAAKTDNPCQCHFAEPGFTDIVSKNKIVQVTVWYSTSPQTNQVAERRKNIAAFPKWYGAGLQPSLVVKDVQDFA